VSNIARSKPDKGARLRLSAKCNFSPSHLSARPHSFAFLIFPVIDYNFPHFPSYFIFIFLVILKNIKRLGTRQITYYLKAHNTAVKRLRMREFLSELSFELVQRLRKSISLGTFIKL
jgi:hypothetical protein